LKRIYEEMKASAGPESAEQEQLRINKNIERMRGQIRELNVCHKSKIE
jgi:hypothetical protein